MFGSVEAVPPLYVKSVRTGGEPDRGEGSAGGDDEDEDKDEDLPAMITVSVVPHPCRTRPCFPITLANLSGGTIPRPLGKPARHSQVVSEEGLYMELCAAEYSDKETDEEGLDTRDADSGWRLINLRRKRVSVGRGNGHERKTWDRDLLAPSEWARVKTSVWSNFHTPAIRPLHTDKGVLKSSDVNFKE
ncbi:hypothetical protein DFH08DRAFT_812406 [Mycena albidolilacea]|uniref:Uncharacterized protein n=1 Tax=Mycena albidolilacea TaxID=1033008 RepID=A0AAD7ENP6_9AGAR|nr:hypothetical protein DFH08DRAFT_812406 [Mycena albidolilacea]